MMKLLTAILILTASDFGSVLTDAGSNNDNNHVRRHRHQERERILQSPEIEFPLFHRDVELESIDSNGNVERENDAGEDCWVTEIKDEITGALIMTGCIE